MATTTTVEETPHILDDPPFAHKIPTGKVSLTDIKSDEARTPAQLVEETLLRELMECGHPTNGRNLVVCIDGTSNQFGDRNTNVIETYNLILKKEGDRQMSWYNSGIGTYARPSWKSLSYMKKVVYHKIDMAIAWDFERTVQGAYRWLCDNYREGDAIFMFGFSRGAYQVRALSAMIETVGLLYPGNEMQIPFAYELYADSNKDRKTRVTKVGQSGDGGESSKAGSASTSGDKAAEAANVGWIGKVKRLFNRKGLKQATNPMQADSQPDKERSPVANVLPSESESQNKSEPGTSSTQDTPAGRFKSAFSRENVTVHFVGAWDTVSSIGIVRGKRMLPLTNEGMKHVCYFRHALALDERRVKFLPEYAYGGTSLPPPSPHGLQPATSEGTVAEPPSEKTADGTANIARNTLSSKANPHTLEVWFAGTHSDIGGGNTLNKWMDRNRPPLRWMILEARALGLRTRPFKRELMQGELNDVQESLTMTWRILEIIPFKRLTFSRENPDATTHKPHLGSPRKIHKGQKIHSSFVLGNQAVINPTGQVPVNASYRPKALPPKDPKDPKSVKDAAKDFWDNFIMSQNGGELAEVDVYTVTNSIVANFLDDHNSEAKLESLHSLRNFGRSDDGRQAIYDAIMNGLETGHTSLDAKYHLLLVTMEHLKIYLTWSLIRKPSAECRRHVGDLLNDSDRDRRRTAWRFLHTLADPCMQILSGHTSIVFSVAFSPDGKQIASGSWDCTLRLWDVDTGLPIGVPFKGHKDWVHCVAFSPDGRFLASASEDRTVRIWNAATGACRSVLKGHTDRVRFVAFAPASDQTLVVSGSDDRTVRLWDYETGNAVGVPLEGHSNRVWAVEVCPTSERKLIASGSWDGAVRLWDYETEPPIQWGEPLTGHSGRWVLTVAFSPEGLYLASGGKDNTICIWDTSTKPTQSCKPIRTLRGHTGDVNSVAVSPNSRWISSGSHDRTVRLWDMENGRQIGEPFRGHEGGVNSVAFSPDGKRAVSGSSDNTVRIWDVEVAKVLQELEVDDSDEFKTRQT